jgi:serine/threonine protein kinase
VLEDLRRREPTYPGVASRIEHLRKQRSAADRLGRTTGTITAGDAPTAFVTEYRYEILEEIGRGGMGVVFKARDRRLDRVVALKRLPEDLRRHQPRAVQLFLREAQAAARLNHPNIVTVYDTDQEDGSFFITMELLSGEPFNKILRDRGPLSPTGVIEVGMQVAAGLEFAHQQAIVHRDIKTANLFLTQENVVKVMDFGLAKMFEEVRGGTTVISGTPFYMSPEQIIGSKVDQRTDLYSLGVTLFELATGRVPFSEGEVAYHHRHTKPPDPRSLRPELPEALARIILDLLEKDPARRCASASELLRRLEHLVASSSEAI